MDIFHAYFKDLSKPARESFAAKVGTSVAYLWQIIYGQRRCSESMAIEIEKASSRKVRVEDMRPDVDWAYIRDSVRSIAESPNGITARASASDDTQPPVGGSTDEEKSS